MKLYLIFGILLCVSVLCCSGKKQPKNGDEVESEKTKKDGEVKKQKNEINGEKKHKNEVKDEKKQKESKEKKNKSCSKKTEEIATIKEEDDEIDLTVAAVEELATAAASNPKQKRTPVVVVDPVQKNKEKLQAKLAGLEREQAELQEREIISARVATKLQQSTTAATEQITPEQLLVLKNDLNTNKALLKVKRAELKVLQQSGLDTSAVVDQVRSMTVDVIVLENRIKSVSPNVNAFVSAQEDAESKHLSDMVALRRAELRLVKLESRIKQSQNEVGLLHQEIQQLTLAEQESGLALEQHEKNTATQSNQHEQASDTVGL